MANASRLAVALGFIVAVGSMSLAAGDTAGERIRPRLAVMQFHDYSEYQGHLLGRRTADALYVALQSTGRWRLIEPAAVRQACEDMDLRPPFAVGYQQALGHRVNADVIVTGRVEGVRISPAEGTVTVNLILDFIDRICGQSIMALQVSGSSRRGDGGPRPTDIIVSEALADACGRIVAITETVPACAAEVVAATGNQLTLQPRTDVPLTAGDRLLLYRARGDEQSGAKLVAVLMVRRADAARVTATVLDRISDIYTGDLAVCVGPARREVKPTP